MATLLQNPDEENKQTQAAAGTAPTQPVITGAGPASTIQTGGSPSNAVAPAPAQERVGSGRFQNIRKYIDANKGTDYAGKIGQGIQEQKQQLQQNLASTQQNVQSQANPEIQRLQAAQGRIQQATTDPTAYAQNAQEVAEFNRLRTGDYLRNVKVDNIGDISMQQQKVAEAADMSGTEGGRYQLLRNTLGGDGYSRGSNKLDQLLLQGQGGQLKTLQNTARTAAQEAQTGVQDFQSQLQKYNQQLGTLGSEAQKAAQTGISGLVDTSKAALDKRAMDLQTQRQGQYNAALEALKAGKLSPELAQQMGITANTNTYNVDPTQYLNANVGNQTITRDNVAKADDVARFQALAALSGQQDLGQYTKVGEELGGPVKFDAAGMQSAVGTSKEAYNTDYNTLKTDSLVLAKKHAGPGTTYTKGGRGYKTLKAIESMDLNAMQKQLKAYSKVPNNPMAKALRKAISGLTDLNTNYSPNKQISIGEGT